MLTAGPCAPDVEQPNYQGFDYLVSELAAQGYVALSININAENTFGFGEPTPGERFTQLIELHLGALVTAAAGGANDFGVPLEGVADMQALVFIGHSRGGEAAVWLAENKGLAAPDAAETFGYGLWWACCCWLRLPSSSYRPRPVCRWR